MSLSWVTEKCILAEYWVSTKLTAVFLFVMRCFFSLFLSSRFEDDGRKTESTLLLQQTHLHRGHDPHFHQLPILQWAWHRVLQMCKCCRALLPVQDARGWSDGKMSGMCGGWHVFQWNVNQNYVEECKQHTRKQLFFPSHVDLFEGSVKCGSLSTRERVHILGCSHDMLWRIFAVHANIGTVGPWWKFTLDERERPLLFRPPFLKPCLLIVCVSEPLTNDHTSFWDKICRMVKGGVERGVPLWWFEQHVRLGCMSTVLFQTMCVPYCRNTWHRWVLKCQLFQLQTEYGESWVFVNEQTENEKIWSRGKHQHSGEKDQNTQKV